jgi:hypothetical protein
MDVAAMTITSLLENIIVATSSAITATGVTTNNLETMVVVVPDIMKTMATLQATEGLQMMNAVIIERTTMITVVAGIAPTSTTRADSPAVVGMMTNPAGGMLTTPKMDISQLILSGEATVEKSMGLAKKTILQVDIVASK